jgi:deoxyribodipyrimidine photolyase-related protein
LLEPKQVIDKVLQKKNIPVESVEGFVRQILGWREYIRGIYWLTMPKYSETNYFNAKNNLPEFYWTGKTDMNCIKNCVNQTIQDAYAHHIQRLMITGNFSLIAGINPKQVCDWYLSVYADAFEWVELPNTHGMTLYADGGIVGTKPYAASGNYINKMSDYCKDCKYDVKKKEGKDACPFNYLYWNFFLTNTKKLENNPRLWTVFSNIKKMSKEKKKQIQNDSKNFLIQITKT